MLFIASAMNGIVASAAKSASIGNPHACTITPDSAFNLHRSASCNDRLEAEPGTAVTAGEVPNRGNPDRLRDGLADSGRLVDALKSTHH